MSLQTYIVFRIILGLFLWTLIEYTLHRWLFHIDARHRSSAFCTFHFLLHGLHHKVPFDPFRLVFPPLPAAILATIFYQPGYFLFDCPKIVLAGCLMGKEQINESSTESTEISWKIASQNLFLFLSGVTWVFVSWKRLVALCVHVSHTWCGVLTKV